MASKPCPEEVLFCGNCKRQQMPAEGERCKICGKPLVNWYLNRETFQDAMKKWQYINRS